MKKEEEEENLFTCRRHSRGVIAMQFIAVLFSLINLFDRQHIWCCIVDF